MNTRFYADMIGVTVRGLPPGSLPGLQVRFMRGIDEDETGGAYVMCVAAGSAPDPDEDRPVVGYLRYADGRWDGPRDVRPEARAALLRDVGLAA